ncbi:TetR/AcrR family transcriptional regulator [Nitriliruptor alkaliphilus]|uniref:TetR/AcrR family transcriptional regulator n=1 Tax=Nitriliruptor alkaliphilus TaxID=427918 RepID=UPI00069671B1|nr:TetR/AcrR family transcriptional regulator [Nitriliruptor alkaliphilus]
MTDTRTRILEAALACFVERGVAATTIDAVRAASGASTGSLYHHFGDRQGLIAAVHGWLLDDYHAGFLAVLDDQDDPVVGVAEVVRFHVGWCTARPDAARFLLEEPGPTSSQLGGEEVAAANAVFLRRVLAWLRPHVRYGAVRELDVATAYALWLGPAQERCRLWVRGRAAEPDEAEIEVLAEAAVRSLCTPEQQR